MGAKHLWDAVRPGSHDRLGTMSDAHDVQPGHVTGRHEGISFRQWTDKGYVFCRAEIPLDVCDCCGAKHWNQDAKAISTRSFGESTTSFASKLWCVYS